MALKGSKPLLADKRLKMFVFGPAGVGKTTAAIMFPQTYIIDCEKGTENYTSSIIKSKSVVFKSNNPDEIKQELKSLLTEKHEFKTVLLDPITQIYNAIQEKWTRIFEKHAKTEKEAEVQDFGMRYWAKVKGDYKSIIRMLLSLDMNVICTSHQKDIYGNGMTKIGVGPDSMRGDDYAFDLVFQLENINGKRMAKTIKERSEIGKNKFPESFEWSYANFSKFYGAEVLQRDSVPVLLASPDQVSEIKRLLDVVKIDSEEINKWFTKADVDSFDEMTSDQISKCIDYVSKKLEVKKEVTK